MSGKRRFIQLATLTLFLGSLLLLVTPPSALGNTDVGEAGPFNLSRSGAAAAPIVLSEDNGTLHVIWQDRFAGFVYTSGTGTNWTEPVPLTFPFSNPPFSSPTADNFNALFTPRLLLDRVGIVHAFWLVEEALLYSNAPIDEITNNAAWTTPQSLAGSAPAFAATVAPDGRLHLAYIRTASSDEFPTGVYYRQRTDGNWSTAARLYQSNYLRSAAVAQLHVDIAAVGSERVFVVWDNYLSDTVYYAQSTNGGSSWSGAVSIDQRGEDDSFDSPGPHYLQLIAHDEQIHLIWNRYSNVGRCELSHRWSADGGREWQARQVLFEGINCPVRRHALVDEATGRLYLFTEQEQGSNVIRAWLDFDWSAPQVRSGLTGFTNPETFRTVSMACFNPVAAQEWLYVIGCGEGSVEDIWMITSNLPDTAQFEDQLQERWQLPEPVVRLSNEQTAPILLTGQEGRIHALWLEQDKSLLVESEPIVRYAYWDGSGWSRPAPIVEGEIDQIAAAITADNRLLLAWRDLREGSIWFNQVDVAQATFPAQWSPPKELVANETAVSQPVLLTTADNQVYLAYALTLNEGRGIYIRRSDDGGLNWLEPMLAFDGAAAGWSMVGAPTLTKTADGGLHLMWSRRSLLQGSQPIAYYYARSLNQGENWSASPTLVADGALMQGQVVAAPTSNHLFRMWQAANDDLGVLWYQESEDAGRTWSQAALIPSLEDLSGDVTTIVDPAGRLHMLHIGATEAGDTRLDSWLWESGGWQAGNGAVFEQALPDDGNWLSAAVQDDGIFLVAFTGLILSQNASNLESRLFYTKRPIVLPEERPSPVAIIEEPGPADITDLEEEAVGEQVAVPTPTVDFAALADESTLRTQFGPIDANTSTGRILAGVLPAGLIVIIGVVLGLYALRTRDSW